MMKEVDRTYGNEQRSGCGNERAVNHCTPGHYLRGVVEFKPKEIFFKEAIYNFLFLPIKFLTMFFWTARFTWHYSLFHKLLILLPLLFFLYGIGLKWQDCPSGPPPYGYAYSSSWLELSAAWKHFRVTGHVEGLLGTVLFFLLLLGGMEFFLPALSVIIVRAIGRRVLSPLTYFNWLEFCFVWLPMLASYALASCFAIALVREFAAGFASIGVWVLGCVLFTPPWFAFREYCWHKGLWWYFVRS